MHPRLRTAVAKIEIRQGGQVTSRGTGTLVAEGLVLTALHVVGDRRSDPVQFLPGEIVLTFPDHTTRATPVDGMCDGALDWALLRCEEPPSVRPVPLGEIDGAGIEWTTYGFPDAQPIDGMVQAGTVRNTEARLNGQPTYQLFSEEASAGQGAPVKGLSGGPVFVDGALVGVLRFALMREGQAVAGTLYACPARIAVEACEGLLPIPDPCHGLPGLPRRPLPAEPYRFLSRYREEDAEIFFGRNRDIRDVYEQVTDDDGIGVVLFYGQTGVGKSSFLDAALVPRLRWTHNVRYLRREASRSLLATLRLGLAAEADDKSLDDGRPLSALWHDVEDRAGRPVVVILDQVEEVYTRRDPTRADELDELGRALQDTFHGARPAPGGQLVLGFRKEWYPEVQQRLEACAVEFTRVFLETLAEEGVAEAVVGLTRTQRLRDRYGLSVAPELPPVVARQLHEDPDSPIAPTLQILLAKMWQTACADNAHAPAFTLDLYTRLKHEGALLGDFLDQQLQTMAERRPSAVASGLVLDVLARHTTPLLTADECSGEELERDYGSHADFRGLRRDMAELYLLVDAGPDASGDGTRSRLAHDTLAPHVRQRYDESAYPGQAAARILLARAPAGANADELAPLDGYDLHLVEAGLPGMRALLPIEQSLIDESRELRRRRRRNRAVVQVGFVVMLIVLAITSLVAWKELRNARTERLFTDLSNTTDKVRSDLVSTPRNGLALSFWAVCRSLEQGFPIANELQMSLSTAIEQARQTRSFDFHSEVNSVAAHPREPRFVVALENGFLQEMTRRGDDVGTPLACFDPDTEPGDDMVDGHHPRAARRVAYSPDGEWLYGAGNDGRLYAVQPGVPGAQSRSVAHGSPIRAVAVSTEGTVATAALDGTIRLWSADLSPIGSALRAADQHGGVNALAFTPEGLLVAGGDGGVLRFWDPAAPAEARREVARHEGPVLAIAAILSRGMGSLVASGGADETVRVFRGDGTPLETQNWRRGAETEHAARDNEREVVIADHQAAVRAIAFARDGAYVLTGDEMGIVVLNDVLGEPASRPFLGPDAAVRSISYFPDGVAVIAGLDHKVRLRSPDGLMVQRDLRPRGETIEPEDPLLHCVAFCDDGTFVAAGDSDGWVTVWDHATVQVIRRLEIAGATAVGVDFLAAAGADHGKDSDADEIVAACDDGTLRVFGDSPEPRVVGTPGAPDAALTAFACNRLGRVVVGGRDGAVRVIELRSDDRTDTVSEGGAEVTAVALSADGRRLAFARADSDLEHEDAVVELWELGAAWQPAGVLTRGDNHGVVNGLAFSSDGETLYSAGADGKLRIRWFATPLVPRYPAQKAHMGMAYAVAASADGTRVVTGGADGAVVLWGVHRDARDSLGLLGGASDDEHLIRVDRIAEMVPAHRWAVRSVAFGGAREHFAASASTDGSVRIWKAHYERWLETAAMRMRDDPPRDRPNLEGSQVGDYLAAPPWKPGFRRE